MKKSMVLCFVLAGILLFSACSAPDRTPESGALAAEPAADPPDSQEPVPAAPEQYQLLMQGGVGGLGLGCLVCALPGEENADYQLRFYKEDFSPDREADYIFPDVREGNAPIGVFQEIYFFDTILVGEDGAAGLAVIADYDVDGETCCNVRIYRWDGTDYLPEDRLMASCNETRRSGDNFPVEELYRLGPDKAQSPAETAAGDWEAAYRSVLLDLDKNLADPWDLRAGPEPDLYVGIHDFDRDGTPELIAGDCVSVAVYTWNETSAGKVTDLYQPAARGSIDKLYLGDNTLVLTSTGSDAGCYVCLTWLDGAYQSGTYNEFAPETSDINGQPTDAEEFRRVFSPRFLPDAAAYCRRIGDALIINGEEIPIDSLDLSLLAW